jgi:hypothetical protein
MLRFIARIAFPLDFVKAVASAFAGASSVRHEQDADGGSYYVVEWERDDTDETAGVAADADGASVFLANAACEVASAREAIALLKRIFADEIVAVTAFEKGVVVFCELARADDPSAGFNKLDPIGGFNMPHIDKVEIRSWSGEGDML